MLHKWSINKNNHLYSIGILIVQKLAAIITTEADKTCSNEALKCKPSAHSKFQLCCIADNDEGGSIIIQQYMLQ